MPTDTARSPLAWPSPAEAELLGHIENWERIEAIVLAQRPPDVDALVAFIHRQTGELHGQLYDLRAEAWGS